MPENERADSYLCILDCLSGTRGVVQKSPFVVGSLPSADFQLSGPAAPQVLCTIVREGGRFEISMVTPAIVNGSATEAFHSKGGDEHSLVAPGGLLALKHTDQAEAWLNQGRAMSWNVYDSGIHDWIGPFGTQQLGSWIARLGEGARKKLILVPAGMEEVGFFVRDVQEMLSLTPPQKPVEQQAWFRKHSDDSAEAPRQERLRTQSQPPPLHQQQRLQEKEAEAAPINSEYGEFTCPICWFKFDRGDAMNIAVHNSLRGDSMLGEEQMQRFHATRFNDRGQALDAMGLATSDLACPHCRRKMPPGFMDLPHHIFSIVGAPSSGKSYYLSVLVKVLQNSLFQNFGITFRDADPSENVILTQMKTQLFSASSPQDAFLAKTDLEGALYETLPRQGRKVRLPKPFIFKVSRPDALENGFSVVFYDNAGEHFEPTSNSADSPGAQHIAVASGIFFLFDPLHNTEFRRKLEGLADPQVNNHRLDQQDVILAETEVRIKSLLGLDSRQRVATPMAVMVGKCDTWLHLLGAEPLLPAVKDGVVSLANIAANSKRIRALLMEICPVILANAEAISSNVCYFAISPLGCSPVEFTDRDGYTRIGPDPQHIKPRHVDVPTLWVLSQVAPGMIPSEPVY